ncbi:MAG: S1 RNA-binding domain-containing protein [Oscillospiraceae bacterium]|nr:S1 RNA-binding domain-containing protein [Oscillospiraceae bacterium]
MNLQVGEILEGKVTGITKFGAFVQLPGGPSGLVHISEIANAFVNDVNDYLHMGDTVKVKVIGITEAGKINLSIKQTESAPVNSAPAAGNGPRPGFSRPTPHPAPAAYTPRPQEGEVLGPSGDASFEDKLKHFMQQSDSKINDSKIYNDRKGGGGRRRR